MMFAIVGICIGHLLVAQSGSIGSAELKIRKGITAGLVILVFFSTGISFHNAEVKASNASEPDSFGTVISERYGMDSMSCRDPWGIKLNMEGDKPSDGEYSCSTHDAKYLYKNLTLVVNNNKAGLYDKKGNALKAGER